MIAVTLVWLTVAVLRSSQMTELGSWKSSFTLICSSCLAFAAEQAADAAATAVVEEYWASEPKSRYSLLSQAYKQRLRRLGVSTASQYANATREPERVWRKRTYQSTKIVGPGAARISLLIEWEQEGYQGVMTFVFDLVLEKDRWRIENIVH